MTGTIHQLKIENQGKLGSKLMDVIRTLKKTSNGTKSVDIFHVTKMNRDVQYFFYPAVGLVYPNYYMDYINKLLYINAHQDSGGCRRHG